ncbi:MAG: NAD-dependent epimerase/dehydratase family protein [Bacteroidales bacterium]|nr:NAD-dependent epimerase/dehydratase family protein [Bacteroidales bacterium]
MILVTGGTGLLGSYLLHGLLSRGYRVRAVKRPNSKTDTFSNVISCLSGNGSELVNRIEWVEGDIMDAGSLENAMHGVDQVFHCAALVSFHAKDKRKLFRINAGGTANLVNAALSAGIGKLCHVSSVAALGRAENQGFTDEKTIWNNSSINSSYGRSKFMSELEVWRGVEEGLKAVIINPSILIGAGNTSKGSARLVSTVARGLKYYPAGMNGFADVRDVAEIMIRLMESDIKNEKFVVNAVNLSYVELFTKIAGCLGLPPPKYKTARFFGECYRLIKAFTAAMHGKEPLLTRETTETAYQTYKYRNNKLLEALPDFHYTPFDDTIRFVCNHYLNRHKR